MADLNLFPDGTPIADWFFDTAVPELSALGTPYVLSEHGIFDDGRLHTAEIQALIDEAAKSGGGVIVVPAGTFLTGALFFKQGVHLYVSAGAVLKGSDFIGDYSLMETRIEGETCQYFAALINADHVDGFVMCGPGTIDGNGYRTWREFELRRTWNPACTNKEQQRPRLVYISNSSNVLVANLRLQNAHFWTNHLYRCDHVKYIGCHIYSPAKPLKATSTDAVDIDVCHDVLVKNCYMEVNDDSVVLKGGKGPWADEDSNNGMNERILVEDCTYGFCHGCLTCGSESIHNRNILVRRVKVMDGFNLLWLKMRPDTPQLYEYIRVEDVTASVVNCLNINPWTQFYDLKGRADIPKSYADHIELVNCKVECDVFFNVEENEAQYHLSNFALKDLEIRAAQNGLRDGVVEGMTCENVEVTQIEALHGSDVLEASLGDFPKVDI